VTFKHPMGNSTLTVPMYRLTHKPHCFDSYYHGWVNGEFHSRFPSQRAGYVSKTGKWLPAPYGVPYRIHWKDKSALPAQLDTSQRRWIWVCNVTSHSLGSPQYERLPVVVITKLTKREGCGPTFLFWFVVVLWVGFLVYR